MITSLFIYLPSYLICKITIQITFNQCFNNWFIFRYLPIPSSFAINTIQVSSYQVTDQTIEENVNSFMYVIIGYINIKINLICLHFALLPLQSNTNHYQFNKQKNYEQNNNG